MRSSTSRKDLHKLRARNRNACRLQKESFADKAMLENDLSTSKRCMGHEHSKPAESAEMIKKFTRTYSGQDDTLPVRAAVGLESMRFDHLTTVFRKRTANGLLNFEQLQKNEKEWGRHMWAPCKTGPRQAQLTQSLKLVRTLESVPECREWAGPAMRPR